MRSYEDTVTRLKDNAPEKILEVIATVFDTEIVSWFEPQFRDFDDLQVWEFAISQHTAILREEAKAQFFEEIIKFVTGKLKINGITGSHGKVKAYIAKGLVTGNPDLLKPFRKEELMKTIDDIYR